MSFHLGCQTFGWLAYASQYGSTLGYKQVLAEVAKTGFVGVDMSGGHFDQLPEAQTVKQECDELGVRIVCFSHGIDDLEGAKRKLELLHITGGTALMVGGGSYRPGDDEEAIFAQLVEDASAMAALTRELGIPAGFHNHLGTVTETPQQIERFLDATDIGWCPDVGHMAAGGGDPLALLEKYASRVVHCHLKDALVDEQGQWVRFCELGQGNAGIDLKRCLEILEAAGFEGWACVEQDQTTVTPFTDQKWNREYLEGLGYGERFRATKERIA